MEYLIVLCGGEIREVWVDDAPQGKTNFILQLEAGVHTVTLGPPYDFAPIQQTVQLTNTSPLQPCRIVFTQLPASAIPLSPGSPA